MKIYIISLFLLFTSYASLATTPQEITHWGIARNDEGMIVYTEKHEIKKVKNKVVNSKTTYFDKDRKNVIATLISDYSKSVSLPTYEFIDHRTKYREGLRYKDGKYVIYYQKPNEKEESNVLKENDSVFSCQGWHYYLINNLETLEKDDIALNLVLPSELDFYSFKIQQVNSSGSKIVANLKLANWFLRIFAPKLRLVYDKNQKKLVEYEGISNILDKDGDRQEVTIYYQYDK
jgi:hypothetical protein